MHDGPTITISIRRSIAAADNPLAYFPVLQTSTPRVDHRPRSLLPRTDGQLVRGRRPRLPDEQGRYPRGTFDDTPDGNGDPQHILPVFRTDLAAPFATEGPQSTRQLGNLVYTVLLDPHPDSARPASPFWKPRTKQGGDALVASYNAF